MADREVCDMMTVGDLKKLLATLPDDRDSREFKIWLPGSRIYLVGLGFIDDKDGAVMLEGNVQAGSALDPDARTSTTFPE